MANEFQTWPILSDFEYNIKTELIRRKKRTFGEGAKPRSSWARAISNAVRIRPYYRENESGITDLVYEEDDLRRDLNIMVGGLLLPSGATRGGFEPVYQRAAKGRLLRDRPMPGIESISVSSKGEYGSLRKITINWSCPSVEDLDILMPYWLSPGISVMVEWGWSNIGRSPVPINIDDDKVMADLYRSPAKIMRDIIIKKKGATYAGNQDFFIGIITNFTWNMNEDGSFTCTTELTTFGETMLALNLNKDIQNEGPPPPQSGKGKKDETKKLLYGIREYVEKAFSGANLDKQIDSLGSSDWKLDKRSIVRADFFKRPVGREIDASGETSGIGALLAGWFSDQTAENQESDDDIYFTWEFIEKKIINDHGCLLVGAEEWFAFKMDSSNTRVINDRMLYSRNPNVLINNNKNNKMIEFNKPPPNYTYYDSKRGEELPIKVHKVTDGFLKNVYLKRSFVLKTFNTSETLEEAVRTMMNVMWGAAFDLWDLRIHTDPNGESVSRIIDQNYISPESLDGVISLMTNKDDLENGIFNFGGYSGDSVLRSISFTSKMTNQVALTYFFGKNKDKTWKNVSYNADSDFGVTAMFGDTVDRVLKNLKLKQTENLDEENTNDDGVSGLSGDRVNINYEGDTVVTWNPGKKPTKYDFFYYENKEDIKYVDQSLRNTEEENKLKNIPIYPLELSVTIDGISGILPGNVFTTDNLPKVFRDTGVFQIVEISHEITSDDWTTTLRAFFRPVDTYDGGRQKSPQSKGHDPEVEESTTEGVL